MATKVFLGKTPISTAQVDHVTPDNVEEDDIFRITLRNRGGDEYTIEFVATAATVQNVVEGLTALAAAAAAAGYAPWDELAVTEDDTKVILTAEVAGEPFHVTTAAIEGGVADTQTLIRSASVACAGPNIWSDPLNWDADTIYADDDDVIVPADLESDIYGETYTTTKPGTLTVEMGCRAAIGSAAAPLEVSLQNQTLRGVELAGTGQQFWTIHYAAQTLVRQTADADPEQGDFGLNLQGTNNTYLYVRPDETRRSVSVAAGAGQSAEFAEIHAYGGVVEVGPAVVKNGAAEIDLAACYGGRVVCECPCKAIENVRGSGEIVYRNAADVDTVTATSSGSVRWETDADITTWLYNGNGCAVDFDAGDGAMTVAACTCWNGYRILENRRRVTWTTGIDLVGCGRGDGVIENGRNYTESVAEI